MVKQTMVTGEPLSQTGEAVNGAYIRQIDDGTGGLEHTDFGGSVEKDLQQRAGQPQRRQNENTQEHIGDLRNTGICQTLFQTVFRAAHNRTHEDGDKGQAEADRLQPGALQNFGAHHAVDGADYGDGAHLGDNAAEQGVSRCRGPQDGQTEASCAGGKDRPLR